MTEPQSPAEFEEQNLENPKIQTFGSFNITSNGQNYNSIDQLPPELRQKVQDGLAKLQSNPQLFNIISSFANIAKVGGQFGAMPITGQNKDQMKQLLQTIEAKNPKLKGLIEGQMNEVTNASSASTSSPMVATMGNANNFAQMNQQLSQQRNINPSYNPHTQSVQSDNLRRTLFILAAALIGGYLIIKFGFNGQLPF